VEYGRTNDMKRFFQRPVSGRPGKMAPDAIRQQKNLIVCTATLVTRAAIRGGLDPETAFNLSDMYIQKAELLNNYVALTRLNAQMVMDFTERIEKVRGGKNVSKLTIDIRNYILQHLSNPITTRDIAEYIGANRTYLCKLFREQNGITINRYILNVKIEEARRLLVATNKSLAEIAFCLGFSSQSHFHNTFHRLCGTTPKQFRDTHKKSR
jgi:AraC-like DNA-binding protein